MNNLKNLKSDSLTHAELKLFIDVAAQIVIESDLSVLKKAFEITVLIGVYMGICLTKNWEEDSSVSNNLWKRIGNLE